MSVNPGDIIGSYRIEEVIGQGGMATVYCAHHERLDRRVAVKILHPAFLSDDNFLQRFNREARIVARLEHPNIVPIYDYDEHAGMPYLVMKFIDGPTLKRLAFKQGLSLHETADLLAEIAAALDYAHAQGILHRDMKPSNILIDREGRAYITDFGLARIAQAGESTISHDMMLGTPYYISPEQAQGERDLDKTTDIYSLGVILYELVTGQVPFSADTPYGIVHGHIYKQPPTPTELKADLPPALDAVLLKALAKKPAERYTSASALLVDFRAAIGELPVQPLVQTASNPGTSTPASDSDQPPSVAAVNRLGAPATNGPTPPAKPVNLPPGKERVTAPKPPEVPRPPSRQQMRGKDGRSLEIEGSLDLGNVNWGQLGQKINEGVRSFAELIEERIDSELTERVGKSFSEEERIRRQVRKRMKERQEFVGHLSAFIGINLMLFAIWFFTSGPDSFPWPMIPLFGWGIGLFSHGMDYYQKYGPGARRQEREIEREVERELARRQSEPKRKTAKAKNEPGFSLSQLDDAHVGDDERPAIRLNDDGELTDSFIKDTRRR